MNRSVIAKEISMAPMKSSKPPARVASQGAFGRSFDRIGKPKMLSKPKGGK